MFVLHGFAGGRRRKHLSHADPWKDFWIAYDAIGPRVSLYKVWKGHVTEAEIAAGLISPLEAYGSDVADKLAERGARGETSALVQLPMPRRGSNGDSQAGRGTPPELIAIALQNLVSSELSLMPLATSPLWDEGHKDFCLNPLGHPTVPTAAVLARGRMFGGAEGEGVHGCVHGCRSALASPLWSGLKKT